jgi:hypothetical protein
MNTTHTSPTISHNVQPLHFRPHLPPNTTPPFRFRVCFCPALSFPSRVIARVLPLPAQTRPPTTPKLEDAYLNTYALPPTYFS